jgi:hypothetical protein
MDTATDQEPRCLMSSTQRLGFLPTRWFWKDKRNRRLVAWLYGAVAFVTIEIGAHIGAHPLIVGASLLLTLPLAEGLLERYVRRQVMKRRALAEPDERKAIGP